MREICTSGSTRGETCAARRSHAPLLYQHCYWRSHPSSARRGMLRLIWSHPEFPTKEDIRDELRRSEIGLFTLRSNLRFRNLGFEMQDLFDFTISYPGFLHTNTSRPQGS